MLSIPKDIADQYDSVLQQRAIPEIFREHYKKWLRYFLDFCQKYPPPEANYDIRTIQIMLGHTDVRTTMIYTHCVPSKTVKEARSPLDF